MRLYQAVTADTFELPLVQREKAKELALVVGITYSNLCSCITRGCNSISPIFGKVKIVKVEVFD